MQLNKSSLFYRFLTMFDDTIFYDYYDEENETWHESTDSCHVFALLIAKIIVCLVILIGLFLFVGSIGLTLGWIAAMIHSFSYIVPGAWECATLLISSVLAVGVFFDVIKSKLSKACVKIDIVD